MISISTESRSRTLFALLVFYAIATFSSMAGMNIAAALLIGFLVLLYRRERVFAEGLRREFLTGAFPGLSLALSAALILSLLSTEFVPLEFGGRSARVSWPADILKLWYFAMPFVLAAAIRSLDERRRHRLLLAWLGAALPLGILAVIQFFTGFPLAQPIPGMPGHFHAILFLGHHLSTGSIFIFPAFVGLALVVGGLRHRSRWGGVRGDGPTTLHLTLYGAGALGSILCLFFSWSRMAWLALPVGLMVVAQPWLSRRGRLAVVGSVALSAAVLFQWEPVRSRLAQAMGIRTRFELWSANWEFFLNRPFLGVGWRKTFDTMIPYLDAKYPAALHRPFVGHAHNNLLEMLAGTGILGATLWLVWCGAVLVIAWRIFRGTGDGKPEKRSWEQERGSAVAWGILTAWLMLHLNGLTQVNFWEGKVQHQMMLSLGWLLALRGISAVNGRSEMAKRGTLP